MSENELNVNIKQRIIGALVLVSLGIIIIPLLLNGGVTNEQSISGDNIPEMPKNLNTVLAKVPKPIVMPVPRVVSSYPERENIKTPELKTLNKQKPASEIKYQKITRPVSSKVDKAYTLQIASFSKKNNADALQNKLRKKKYQAYIESIKTPNGKIYRLRVGPYLKFEQMSTIKKQIEKQFKLKNTVIIKY